MISGVLTEIYKDIRESVVKKRDASKAEIENASHRYDKNYRDRHGQLKVSCVDMWKPILLDDVYVAVQFLNQHTASRYSSLEDVEQAFQTRRERRFDSTSNERQDGTQVANDEQYLMLLGGAGVGKSTFLRKIGLEALKGKDGNFKHECIPVFLELKRFTEVQIDIETLIAREFDICGFPHPEELAQTVLKSGKLLILFDGLDEVPAANVNNIIDKIGDFVDQYSQNRFVASCRIAAYKGGFTRFTEVKMAAFDDSQIQGYIKNWFDSTTDPNFHRLGEQMNTAEQCWTMLNGDEHSATKELARNPLLLTLLCMVYDNSQNFQRNRANLYEDALNIFLREWLAEKRVRRDESISQYLDITDEKRMLSEIAAKNFEANCLFFGEDELITQIQEFGEGNANTLQTFSAPKILDTILIDQGLFVERVTGSYSFSHLIFQEYLTANYIVGHPQSIQALVKEHLHDEQWREVFLLTAGLMRKADDLLVAMEAEAAKSINTPRLKALSQWTERITNTTGNWEDRIAKRSFAMNQCFSVQMLNGMYEAVENPSSRDLYLDQYRDLYLDQYRDLYLDQYRDLDLGLHRDLDLYIGLDRYRDQDPYLDQYRDLYLNLYPYRYPYRDFYQDFYRYMDADFYLLVFDEFGDRFDEELQERIALIKCMEQMNIFKSVDLQQMVRRFNAQREFIQAAAARKDVKPPAKFIHDTWLSVLNITNEMPAISPEELECYIQYLRAVKLIVACKEAAGHVSPDVWNRIEDRLFACGTEESED